MRTFLLNIYIINYLSLVSHLNYTMPKTEPYPIVGLYNAEQTIQFNCIEN